MQPAAIKARHMNTMLLRLFFSREGLFVLTIPLREQIKQTAASRIKAGMKNRLAGSSLASEVTSAFSILPRYISPLQNPRAKLL